MNAINLGLNALLTIMSFKTTHKNNKFFNPLSAKYSTACQVLFCNFGCIL